VATAWIVMELIEGKNRQVRRMTAAVGHPTLRHIRVRIGRYRLRALPPGRWRILDQADRDAVLTECSREEMGVGPGRKARSSAKTSRPGC